MMLLSCISSCFHDEKSSEIEDKANFIFGEESKLSRLSRQGYAELYCKVYDAQTRHPVGGANVTVFDVERYEFYDTLTSPVGLADFSVLYTNGEPDYVIVKKAGYQSEKIEFYVTKPELYMNIYLTPTRMHNVDGTVYLDGLGVPAEVYFLGVDTQSYGVWYDAYCDDYGKYSIEIPEGVYELHANYEGYENVTLIVLKGDRTVDLFLDSNLEWYNFTVKGFVNDTFGHAVDVSKVSLSFTFWDEDGERIFEKYCMYETNETTGEYEYKVELPALSGYVQISAGGYEGYLRKRVVREINSNILWQNISLVRSPESTATLHVVINNLGDETFAILYDLKHEYMFVSSRINSSGEVDWQVYGSEYALVVVDTNNWNVNVSYVSVGDYEEKNVDCILEEYVKVEEYKTDMIFSGWQNVTVCKSAKLTKTESIFERLMLECGGLIGYEIFDKDGVLNRDGMISAEECNLYRNYSRYGSLKEKNQLPQLSVEGISFMLVDGISDISSISLLAWGASNWSIKNYEGEIFSNKRVEINYSYELCTVSNIQPSSSYIYDVLKITHIA
ncbi:MAG: hypothetical protein QXT63_01015 [Thermoplasmata archaeon]